LTIVDFGDAVGLEDPFGLYNDLDIHFAVKRDEQKKQRDLDDREMGFMRWGDQDNFIAWFADLMKQRPDWKAPNLRLMSIESTLKASCERLLEEVSHSQNQSV